MINVVFDSSALRSLKPRGSEARVLRQLVKLAVVTVHVSTIVEREVATGLADETTAKLRINWAPESVRDELDRAFQLITRAGPIIELGVKEWLDAVQAKRHPPTAEEAARAFDAYFTAKKPFRARNRKSREHIPDAFILESLRTVAAASPSPVRFLTKDSAQGDAAREIPNVDVHTDVGELLRRIDIARPLTIEEMISFAREQLNTVYEMIETDWPDSLVGYTIRNSSFPSSEATIISVDAPRGIDFDEADSEPLGIDTLWVPFHCTLPNCVLEVVLHQAELLNDEKYTIVESGDFYVKAQFRETLEVEAHALVQVRVTTVPKSNNRELELGDIDIEADDFDVARS